jgi:transposase-like protein
MRAQTEEHPCLPKSLVAGMETRPLAELDFACLYLDAIALRVQRRQGHRRAGTHGGRGAGGRAEAARGAGDVRQRVSNEAWKGFLDDLVERGIKAPLLCIVDGNAGLRRALALVWGKISVEQCRVHYPERPIIRRASAAILTTWEGETHFC